MKRKNIYSLLQIDNQSVDDRMARTVKDPEERKNDILDVAEELFITKGYENTSIKDIIEKLGVAHGLFYYYFKSKEDVLNSIVIRYWNDINKGLEIIVHDDDLGPVEKIESIFLNGVMMKKERMNVLSNVVKIKNPLFVNKILKYGIDMFIPLLMIPVEEGIEKGLFDVEYPEYVLEMYFRGASFTFDAVDLQINIKSYGTKMIVMFDMLERMLGAKKGTFKNIKETISSMIEDIVKQYYGDMTKD